MYKAVVEGKQKPAEGKKAKGSSHTGHFTYRHALGPTISGSATDEQGNRGSNQKRPNSSQKSAEDKALFSVRFSPLERSFEAPLSCDPFSAHAFITRTALLSSFTGSDKQLLTSHPIALRSAPQFPRNLTEVGYLRDVGGNRKAKVLASPARPFRTPRSFFIDLSAPSPFSPPLSLPLGQMVQVSIPTDLSPWSRFRELPVHLRVPDSPLPRIVVRTFPFASQMSRRGYPI